MGAQAPGHSGKVTQAGVASWMSQHADHLGPSGGCISEERGVIPLCIFESSRGSVHPPFRSWNSLSAAGGPPLPGQSLGQEASPLQGKSLDHPAATVPSLLWCTSPLPSTPHSVQMGRPLKLHPLGPAWSGLCGG